MEAQAAILVWATRLARHWCGSAYLVRLTRLAPLVEAVVSVLYAVVVSVESDSDYFKIVLIVSVLTSVFLSIFLSNSLQADLLFVSSCYFFLYYN